MVNHKPKHAPISRRFILLSAILACLMLLASTWTRTAAQSGDPQRSVTPTAAFLDPMIGETVTTEHLLSIDPLYVTATAFILQATQTISAQQTAPDEKETTEYLLTVDPFYVTATAFSRQATQTIAAQQDRTLRTPTAISTLTAQEIDDLYSQWKTQLETKAGFSHPMFDYIAYGWALEMSYRIAAANSSDSFRHTFSFEELEVNLEKRETTYDGDKYLAILVNDSLFRINQLLIFRLDIGIPILVFDSERYPQDRYYLWLTFSGLLGGRELGGFADRNGNGLPDLVLENSPGGASCNRETLTVLEIQRDGSIADITPSGRYLNGFVDLNDDGVMEINGEVWFFDYADLPGIGCLPIRIQRWYGWDGTAYKDISDELGESAYPVIQGYWDGVAQREGCLVPDYSMYALLVNYRAMGRLQEGWTRLGPLLQWEKCSPETLVEQSEELGQFLKWIGTELQDEQQTQP